MAFLSSQMKTRLNAIIDSEVLDRVIKRHRSHSKAKLPDPKNFPYITGRKEIGDSSLFDGNIERYFGLAQLPIGIIGPLKVNGSYAKKEFFVPLATTEGALVASYHRGAKLISLSSGANVMCLFECMNRSPGFIFSNVFESTQFVAWVSENLDMIKQVVRTTTQYGYLEDFDSTIDGKYVWINFKFVTGDAAGQNMVTIATQAICHYILDRCPVKARKWYVDANMSGDKKATRMSQLTGRGKHVIAEVTIPKKLCRKILHVSPEEIVEYTTMATIGGIHSGSIGVNGHFANALAALFIACGQDVACVAESCVGTSKAELTDAGDLYVSVSIPNLVVGTIGGGTRLPTQKECLEIMECYGIGQSKKFAEICAAVVLAGEISIVAAIAGGYFTKAHQHLARKRNLSKKAYNYINANVD